MSAMVFGMECPQHIAGDLVRETDSMNIGVYERTTHGNQFKAKGYAHTGRNPEEVAIRESAEQKQETRRKMLENREKKWKNCRRWK